MDTRGVTQSHNYAAGDIAARDINKTVIQHSPSSALREMADKFKLECESDKHLSSFIDRLEHFLTEASEIPSRDLATKLQAGARGDLVESALQLKEQFTKKLLKYQFSEQAQQIFAHVLSKIHAFYAYRVVPLAKSPRAEVDALIYNELLVPLYDEVGGCKLIDLTDLQGMVYFLGGNCHIKWD
jgi:hypothetical protein